MSQENPYSLIPYPGEEVAFRPRGFAPADPVSDEWERRAGRTFVVAFLGLLLGALSLILSDVKDPDWVGFVALGIGGLFLVSRLFPQGVVFCLAFAWINIGSPSITQGASGGGAQRLMLSHLMILLLLSIYLGRQIFHPKPSYKIPITIPFTLYILVCAWSVINSILFPNTAVMANAPRQYVQVNILEMITRVLSFGGLLLMANGLQGKFLRAGMAAIVLPGLFTLVGLVRIVPCGVEWMGLTEIISVAILAAFALDKEVAIRWRILAAVAGLAMFGMLFLVGTEWVSGWFGATIALLLVGWFGDRRLLGIATALVLLVIAANFPYFYQKIYVQNFYHNSREASEYGTMENDRSRMLKASLRYATTFPLGIGPGNYRSYSQYFGEAWHTPIFTSAHGTYAQTLTETGFLGLATLLWTLYAAGSMMARYYRALPRGPAKTYLLGAWGGVIGLFSTSFIGDYLFPTYHNGGMGHFGCTVYAWLLIGLCAAIAREHGLEWDQLKGAAKESEP